LAFAMALAAWLVLVPGSAKEQVTMKIPVVVDNLPAEFELVSIDPDSVVIQASGPRHEMLLAADANFSLVIDAGLARLGRRTFSVQREQVQHGTELKILTLSPQKVRLSLTKENAAR
jgi:hypothetical protein